jgi:hypothetical protein
MAQVVRQPPMNIHGHHSQQMPTDSSTKYSCLCLLCRGRQEVVGNGFDDLEPFFTITDRDLASMGVLFGHRRKIVNQIAKVEEVRFLGVIN